MVTNHSRVLHVDLILYYEGCSKSFDNECIVEARFYTLFSTKSYNLLMKYEITRLNYAMDASSCFLNGRPNRRRDILYRCRLIEDLK